MPPEWDGTPRREADRLLSQVLSEILKVKETIGKIASKQERIETEIEYIKEQTTKTNGRVGSLEVKVSSLEITRAQGEGYSKASDKAERRFSQFVFTPTTTLLIAILAGVVVFFFTGR